jgi:formate dehydrogenase accessory protein FdhD
MPEADSFETGSGRYGARRFERGSSRPDEEESLVEEMPVALNYNERPHAVMMATPTHLEDFAIGFSITEGIVERSGEITEVDVIPSRHGVAVMMRIPEARAALLDSMRRSLPGMGGCGLCGIEKLEAAIRKPRPVGRELRASALAITRACEALPAMQDLGRRTGASHAAVFARPDGELVVAREDAARHNAMDKLVGHLARSGAGGLPPGFVLVTSRASYELVQKAATAGFELMAAISAPTGLAVRLAQATGMTLIGFARDGRFTCYANEFRLG